VRSDRVVVPSPLLDDNLRFLQAVEDFVVQQLLNLPGRYVDNQLAKLIGARGRLRWLLITFARLFIHFGRTGFRLFFRIHHFKVLFRSVRVKPDDLPNYLRAPNVPCCGHAANMARGGTSFHRPQRALIHLTHYSIETLGEAYQQGWRVRVRCAWGRVTA
jgi:hypothetical protein